MIPAPFYKQTLSTRWWFFGRLFPGALLCGETESLDKDGRKLVMVRRIHERAVKLEFYANYPATKKDAEGILLLVTKGMRI